MNKNELHDIIEEHAKEISDLSIKLQGARNRLIRVVKNFNEQETAFKEVVE